MSDPKPRELRLTPRETGILDALVAGKGTSADIAERVGITKETTRTHMVNIMAKTGLHSRVQIAVWWAIAGRYIDWPSR